MGNGVYVLMVVGVVGVAALYWFKVGRKGGADAVMRQKLGLRDGEQITKVWSGYYDIDRSGAEKVSELLGAGVRGVSVIVVITDTDRLVIGNNEKKAPPISFGRGDVAITRYADRAEARRLVGPNGSEKAHVALLTPANGAEAFRVQIVASGVDELMQWAA